MPLRIEVIINAGGGSCAEDTEQLIRDEFAHHDVDVNIHLARDGAEIESLINAAIESDADIIVAGGGDGTISGIAAEVTTAGKTLGVLPLGTLNHFSKDLGIPQTLPEAVRVIAEHHTSNIDLAEVNGRVFINNSSIGLYPRIVRHRELQQHRLGRGKWSAAFIAALRALRFNSLFRVRLKLGDRAFVRKTPFVFVGNNDYEMDFYNIGTRRRLDSGKLSVYFLHRGGRIGVFMLLLRTVFGLLRQTREFEEINTEAITIVTRKKRLMVAFDGEVAVMETPLEYRIRPGALRVIVPRPEAGAEDA